VGKGVVIDQFVEKASWDNPDNPYTKEKYERFDFARALSNRVQRPASSYAGFVAGNGSIGSAGFFYKDNPITADDLQNLTPSKDMVFVNSMYVRTEAP
jgi:hypothetical protein